MITLLHLIFIQKKYFCTLTFDLCALKDFAIYMKVFFHLLKLFLVVSCYKFDIFLCSETRKIDSNTQLCNSIGRKISNKNP